MFPVFIETKYRTWQENGEGFVSSPERVWDLNFDSASKTFKFNSVPMGGFRPLGGSIVYAILSKAVSETTTSATATSRSARLPVLKNRQTRAI